MLMPRMAREKIPFGTYLISQTCTSEKKIFETIDDRKMFIEIIKEKKEQFNFKVYGYCLSDDQAYKIIIYDNGSDISKIMKSINISLAYYLKDRGKMYKDRYKSTLLKTPEELESVLMNLHDHRNTIDLELNPSIIDSAHYFTPVNSSQEKIIIRDENSDELCIQMDQTCKNRSNCIRSMLEGKKVIEELSKKHQLSTEDFLSNKKLRNAELLNFRKMTTLSLKEIGLLFGGLSESAVCKILSRSKN